MQTVRKEEGSGNWWRFFSSISFLLLFLAVYYFVLFFHNRFWDSNFFWDEPPGLFDFLLIVLATQRMTRLMVYDGIMLWFRDLFWDCSREIDKQGGITYINRKKPKNGFRRLMADLLACPWCVGVWLSLLAVTIYFIEPIGRVMILILAVAGLSGFLQIMVNFVGWCAEEKKIKVEKPQ